MRLQPDSSAKYPTQRPKSGWKISPERQRFASAGALATHLPPHESSSEKRPRQGRKPNRNTFTGAVRRLPSHTGPERRSCAPGTSPPADRSALVRVPFDGTGAPGAVQSRTAPGFPVAPGGAATPAASDGGRPPRLARGAAPSTLSACDASTPTHGPSAGAARRAPRRTGGEAPHRRRPESAARPISALITRGRTQPRPGSVARWRPERW